MIVLDCIDPADIDQIWPVLEPEFAKACKAVSTSLTPQMILAEAKAGRRTLWAIYIMECPLPILAAFSSKIDERPDGKTAIFEALGGHDMDSWLLEALGKFEDIARREGVKRIEAEGRLGWAKVLPGYRPVRVILEKEI